MLMPEPSWCHREAFADCRLARWLLRKAVSEKLLGDRGDGPQRGWL
jgi:hypothetical protein